MTPQAREICDVLEAAGLRNERVWDGGARTRTRGQKTVVIWFGDKPVENLGRSAWALRREGWTVEANLEGEHPHLVVWAKLPLLDRA